MRPAASSLPTTTTAVEKEHDIEKCRNRHGTGQSIGEWFKATSTFKLWHERKSNIEEPFSRLMQIRCKICAQGHGKARDSKQFCMKTDGKHLGR